MLKVKIYNRENKREQTSTIEHCGGSAVAESAIL